jgi:hypothetical protein
VLSEQSVVLKLFGRFGWSAGALAHQAVEDGNGGLVFHRLVIKSSQVIVVLKHFTDSFKLVTNFNILKFLRYVVITKIN